MGGRESDHPLAADGESAVTERHGPVTVVRTDEELVAGCRDGDENAWTELVHRYERLIFTVALRNGLSRDDAADITQVTFAALVDALGQLRDHERLPFWLMTVARRQAWRLRRLRDRERGLPAAPPTAYDPTPDWERTAEVSEALGHLGQPCRDLIEALYFDPAQPTYLAIAHRLGRAVGSLGPMRGRCFERLRVLLRDPDDPR